MHVYGLVLVEAYNDEINLTYCAGYMLILGHDTSPFSEMVAPKNLNRALLP